MSASALPPPPVIAKQIEDVIAEFKKFDKNNDGKLSKQEYYTMLRADGKNLNEKHLKAFFFAVKPDDKGAIVFDELVQLMNDVKDGKVDTVKLGLTKNLLKHYDRNHDGQIKLKEFRRIAHDFDLTDDAKTEELFNKIDANKNHQITCEELLLKMGELFGF